jgi:hypothetical protein
LKVAYWRFYFVAILAFLIGLVLGGFIFGRLIHEIFGHALVCYLFGLQYHFSLNEIIYGRPQVEFMPSYDPLINLLVRLGGGLAQASFSMLFFGLVEIGMRSEKFVGRMFWPKFFNEERSPILGIFLGFELSLLTIAFHGIVTALVEGFFYEYYVATADNLLIWIPIVLLCGIMSFLILYKFRSFHK